MEVGSWHGASIIRFLLEADAKDLNTEAICVDTWLGSIEHWANRRPNGQWSFEHLLLREGEPQFIEAFRENIARYGYTSRVNVLRSPSDLAIPYLKRSGINPQLVYVDGDHSFRAVRRDVRNSLRLTSWSEYAFVAGDDWDWLGVRWALFIAMLGNNRRVFHLGKTWLLSAPGTTTAEKLKGFGWASKSWIEMLPHLIEVSAIPSVFRRIGRRILRSAVDPIYSRFRKKRNVRSARP